MLTLKLLSWPPLTCRFPTRAEVDRANTAQLNKIKEAVVTYHAVDTPGWDDNGNRISADWADKLLANVVAPKQLVLKVCCHCFMLMPRFDLYFYKGRSSSDASQGRSSSQINGCCGLIIFMQNLVQGELVNGTIGRVVGYSTTREALNSSARLGVADGTASRSAGEVLDDLKRNDERTSKEARKLIGDPRKWPIVNFHGHEVLCPPAQWEVNNAEGQPQAQRAQVPLILAWALSIHKSQGQTLDRVRVNLDRIFEKGQGKCLTRVPSVPWSYHTLVAYVALSRATSLQRLQVMNFDPIKYVSIL